MKTPPIVAGIGLILSCFLCAGCESDPSGAKVQTGVANSPKAATAKQTPAGPVSPQVGQGKKVKLSKNSPDSVYLEILPDGKRVVLVESKVCRREGMLEHLLCKKMTKEHEAILHADVDAAIIHAALLAAEAQVGKPVQFQPAYKPAYGTVIKVWVQYKDKTGKLVTEMGQKWLRNMKTMQDMSQDWVFAGSYREPDPLDATKPGFYGANSGDVICIANFPASLLDIAVPNEDDNRKLDFEPFTDRIPPLETPVTVILEPVIAKK